MQPLLASVLLDITQLRIFNGLINMCGISGILHLDSQREVSKDMLQKMTDIIGHRGPDDEGFYINNNLGLGHRRLSIIDLSGGDQPMVSDDGSLIILFNGEIYNYIELRKELKSLGYSFKTSSDTEVIIKAYQEWNYKCLNRFNGMWAFAIWNKQKKELFVSRDRIGEKPLHYAVYDNSLIFGSEIKSLVKFGIPEAVNTELLDIYLTLGYIPAPYTFYDKIKKLSAGHFLLVKEGKISIKKYWDLPYIDEENMLANKEEIYEKFKFLLKDSIELRMRSDVPFGAFLSGGLDSASVVALMSEISEYPVETFTIGYKDKFFDESGLAELVAKRFKTNHHLDSVKQENFDDFINKVHFHYDEPFGDSSAIPTGQVCNFASKDLKVVLTGDGGDEVLSGYTVYQGDKFANQYQRFPKIVRKGIPRIIHMLSSFSSGNFRYKLSRAKNVLESSNFDFIDRLYRKISWIEVDKTNALLKPQKVYPARDYLADVLNNCTYKDSFYKLMYFNLKISLPDDMLVKIDRMSMAHSLEARTPFLDYRLVEYMAHVDKNVKMRRYERKSVLRNSIAKELPQELLKAGKMGFRVPVREWFKSEAFESKLNILLRENFLLDKKTLKSIVGDNYSGKNDYGNFIWMIFVLNNWLTKINTVARS